jgi:DNA end-binding protein Ku
VRSIWKGAISFGLVTIPIKVLGATENHSVSFRQLHTTDGGRIRYRKVCELEDQEVSGEEISKGYEAPDGTLVPLSDAELAKLPLPTARTVDILGFVAVDSIDLIQLDRSYYLAPDTGSEKPYVLLREAMERGGKGAIAKLAMRGRETLALLRPMEDGVLGMHTMLWPDEIRSAEGVGPRGQVTIRDAELDLADTLMESLGEVDLEELHDEYRTAVEELVTAKLNGTEPVAPPEAPPGGKVIDLMSALEDSVRAAERSRGGNRETDATVTELGAGGKKKAEPKKSTTRQSTAKKATAKKTEPKKTEPKKATAKKSTAKKGAAKRTKKSA